MTETAETAARPAPACGTCGAPAEDRGGIIQCTADVAHIDIPDLAAVRLPVTLRRKPGLPRSQRPRPDRLTPGELTAIGWARDRRTPGDGGDGWAAALRGDFPWLPADERARLALWFGSQLEMLHHRDGDIGQAARMLTAAAVSLADEAASQQPVSRRRQLRDWLAGQARRPARLLRRPGERR